MTFTEDYTPFYTKLFKHQYLETSPDSRHNLLHLFQTADLNEVNFEDKFTITALLIQNKYITK